MKCEARATRIIDCPAAKEHRWGAARAFLAAAPLFASAACGGSEALPTDGPVDRAGELSCCDVVPRQPDAPIPDGAPWYIDGPPDRRPDLVCCDVVPRQPDGPTPIDLPSPFIVDGRDLRTCQQAFYTSPGCPNIQPKMVCASPDGGASGAMLLYCGCSGNTGTFSVVDGVRGAFEPYQFEGCCPGSIVNSTFGTYLCIRVMDGGSLDVFPADVPLPDGPVTPIDAPTGAIDAGVAAIDGAPWPG